MLCPESAVCCAAQVVCTGREERLLDCHFPEAFGSDGNSSVGGTGGGGGYGEQRATSSPLPADPGIATALCARADNRGTPFMKVACRQFELLGVLLRVLAVAGIGKSRHLVRRATCSGES